MEIMLNQRLIQASNQLHLSVLDHGLVQIHADWHGENVHSLYSRLYIVRAGAGELSAAGRRLGMQPEHAYLIPAGTTFTHHAGGFMEKLYFHINLMRPDGYDLLSGCDGLYELPLSREETEALFALYREETEGAALRLQEGLLRTLGRFMDEFGFCRAPVAVYSPVVQKAIDYIQHHLSAQLSVRELAQRLFVSESKLGRSFRQEVGLSTGRYIDGLLFRAAERQLIHTDRSLKQISDGLGFADQFYFSRRFKAQYGQAPAAFRRQICRNRTDIREPMGKAAPRKDTKRKNVEIDLQMQEHDDIIN